MENVRVYNDEVLFTQGDVTRVTPADLLWLKERAARNPRQRIRLCAHPDPTAKVQEMLIVHARDAYVRPHRHLNKPESFHLIEGLLSVILFDDAENVQEIIPMGAPPSGRVFYYRLERPLFHTVVIESDFAVFHETTGGPFNRADTLFPPWAPEDKDPAAPGFHLKLRSLLDRKPA